jgi:lipopolysaccharide export system permease protein
MNVTSRYILRQFGAVFAALMAAFVVLYMIVDFLDRLDILLRHDASLSASVRYFVFKIPLMITHVLPAATLVATLLSLGMLARSNEITAWRASGVSLWQTGRPVLVAAMAISLCAFAWEEFVVPYAARQFEHVNRVEIRKLPEKSLLSDRQIWFQGREGFYNVDLVDMRRKTLYGLTIYRVTPDFEIAAIIEVDSATWTGDRWHTTGIVEHAEESGGDLNTRTWPDGTDLIEEPINEFLAIKRNPEELSYRELRDRIDGLSRKGIDASHLRVDLNLKLAVPFAALVLAWIGVPIAGAVRHLPSIPQILAGGLIVGFSYWVILGFARSLGETGLLDPVLAAWSANGILGLVGIALFLGSE